MCPPARPLLLALDRDPHHAGLLASSLSFQVVRISSWRALYAEAAHSPATTVVCVDPYFGTRRGLAPELGGLLLLLPSTRVVATLDLSAVPTADLLELGRLGVAEVVGRAVADVRDAVQRIQALAQPPLVARIDRAFEGRVDPGVRALVRTAAELAGSGRPTPSLAGRLYVSERTLLRACTRLGIPGPQHLMGWTRVLHAVALLDEPGRRVRDAALAAGFASDRSLRRAVQRYLGCPVERLRRGGAFPRAVRRFVHSLHPTLLARPSPRARETGAPLSASVF